MLILRLCFIDVDDVFWILGMFLDAGDFLGVYGCFSTLLLRILENVNISTLR